jgi:hypothetical protein
MSAFNSEGNSSPTERHSKFNNFYRKLDASPPPRFQFQPCSWEIEIEQCTKQYLTSKIILPSDFNY